jgi:hypothetical protein
VTPDIEVRLLSVIKAIEQIIMPAIDPANPMAREQAAIAIGHLRVIRGQSAYLADYQLLCLEEMVQLGQELVAAARGGPATMAAISALRSAIRANASSAPPLSALAARRDAIATAVDHLINASAIDGSDVFLQESERIVVRHGSKQADRDRAWFKATGLDPDAATLPTPVQLLANSTEPFKS